MSLDGVYDPNNIFAKIVRGEIPSARICEDANTLAFMDAFPQVPGHCLVVHKSSMARNLLDVEPQALNEVMATVQKVARAVRKALKPDGITITQFNGAPAGQTIFHLHFHILPRREGVQLRAHTGEMAPNDVLQRHAEAIRAALAST